MCWVIAFSGIMLAVFAVREMGMIAAILKGAGPNIN